jgi:hypothetical protein
MELPRELELIAAACRAAYDCHAPRPSFEGVDGGRLMRFARFHRVQGLVWRGVRDRRADLPESVSQALAEDAAEIAAANLRSTAECRKLQQRFEAAGVPLLFIKGLTLAALVYGDAWSKSAVDIDIQVAPDDLRRAAALLMKGGYALLSPAKPDALPAAHRWGKESSWVRAGTAVQVDLHTRLSDNPRLIPTIGLQSPQQSVAILEGVSLPTLADDHLLAYLTVHGASSAWFRLKWVTDLAAFLHNRPAEEVARLYRRSQELGAGRAAAQALLLADRLYDSLDDCPDLKRSLTADSRSRWLYRQALRQLAGRDEPVEPTAQRGGTLRIHLTQFLLLPGLRFKASEAVRQARAALG